MGKVFERAVRLFNTMPVAYTHAGVFHADDVFASALLKIYFGDYVRIVRTFNPPEDADLVFDIGLGRYDHHQVDKEVRENGVPYAAFGLFWEELGPMLVGEEDAARLDESFVQVLDETDNMGTPNPLSAVISSFNPSWDGDETEEECFEKAVAFAKQALEAQIQRALSAQRAADNVSKALADMEDGIVVLNTFCPWQAGVVSNQDASFVVFPSQRGGWNLQVVPKSPEDRASRIPLPESWLTEKPAGCTFVHTALFLAAFDTRENAISAARALVQGEKGGV